MSKLNPQKLNELAENASEETHAEFMDYFYSVWGWTWRRKSEPEFKHVYDREFVNGAFLMWLALRHESE